MIASSNNCPSWSTSSIAQACAITFQGNASNKLQQDAFFFLDNWYQETPILIASPKKIKFHTPALYTI